MHIQLKINLEEKKTISAFGIEKEKEDRDK